MIAGEVVELVRAVVREPARRAELIDLLRDENPLYRGRGALAVVRSRALAMQAFESVRLPEEALSFVFEDLESSYDAHAVAAAARALRGWQSPSRDVEPLLRRALDNIRGTDDYVRFPELEGSSGETTAREEIARTLRWLETTAAAPAVDGLNQLARSKERPASLCCGNSQPVRSRQRVATGKRGLGAEVMALEFEDQDGATSTFADLFVGRPAIVAFFYTRCENPRKCSLTVTKLGRVQKLLTAAGLKLSVVVAAISYDPLFDSPRRLRAYGEARGFIPDEQSRLLRTRGGFEVLARFLSLGVNFVESIVNRHRIEVYVLDGRGQVAAAFVRLAWDERAVVDEVEALLAGAAHERERTTRGILGRVRAGAVRSLPAVLLALAPKCPACWVAYLSAAGIVGIERTFAATAVVPLLSALVVANLAATWRRYRLGAGGLPVALAGAGAVALIPIGVLLGVREAIPVGVLLTVAGALSAPRGAPAS